ncbi:MAG: terminase small subunit [Dehalococcoidia bacterium]
MGKNRKLTQKQAKFVEEFLVDLNATQAAIRAGYSPKTAFNAGWQNVRKCEDAIAVARQELSAKSGITPEKVIQGFADLAFADLAECYDENGILKNIHDIPKSARMAVAGLEVFEEFAGKGEDKVKIGETKKVKLWDKVKALDSLAKHFGLYDADNKQKTSPLTELLERLDGRGLPTPSD